jgi:lipopolysaccharide/colanic/teichoic acid biosynthesis glycosyltransferase
MTGRASPAPAPVFSTGRADIHCLVQHQPKLYDRVTKPLLDHLGALLLLLALLPVLAMVATAVWLKLGGPVVIRQKRVGKGGRVFLMYKFRTMLPDRRRHNVAITAGSDRRRNHKSADDPRHTPLGRVMRRTGLDELPQLCNVLLGDMSLVGPRPELAEVVEKYYRPWQLQRHQVKPGITGLWQVTDRVEGDGVMHLQTDIDLVYIEECNLSTDLRILLRTPSALMHRVAKPSLHDRMRAQRSPVGARSSAPPTRLALQRVEFSDPHR